MEPFAAQQIEKFAAEGVQVSPADAVRLEWAARRLCRAKAADGAKFYPAPRACWCGGVLLHEPTIQSELWLEEVADAFAPRGWIAKKTGAEDLTRFWMRFFACAHADEPGFFDRPEMRTASGVKAEIAALRRKVAATREEAEDALVYCVYGDPSEDLPDPTPPRRRNASDAAKMTRRDQIYADLAEAIGVSGAKLDDLKRLTVPAIYRAMRRAWEVNEWKFKDCETAPALAAWYALVDEIAAKRKETAE